MPMFEFQCKNCDTIYMELAAFDETGVYAGIDCPSCESVEKEKLISACVSTFTNPRGTSKQDSWSYRAGWNMNAAKELRRSAEENSHMGSQPYTAIDDVSSGRHEGTVK